MLSALENDGLRNTLKAVCLAYWAVMIAGVVFAPSPWGTYALIGLAFISVIHIAETLFFANHILKSGGNVLNGFAQTMIFGILWAYRYLMK